MQPRMLSRLVPLAAALGSVGLAAACARQGAPPGGPEDRRPPVVVATEPDTFAQVEDFAGPVRFIFDERISERVEGGDLDAIVLVSPRTGAVRVSRGRRSLEVELEGGFRPGLVYRVTLLPAVRDLFSNALGDPFELVFSTGGEPARNALAGQAWDRISGNPVRDAAVLAIAADSTVHVARADTGGVFAFRFLPPGRYTVVAFQDRDRDGEAGEGETQGSQPLAIGEADTVLVDVGMLQPDTSPALLTGVELLDSVTLVLEFDDYLDPQAPTVTVGVGLTHETRRGPSLARVFQEWEYDTWVGEVSDSFARLDSIDAAAAAAEAALWEAAAAMDDPQDTAAPPGGDAPTFEPDSGGVPAAEPDTAGAPEDTVPARPPGPPARPVPPLLPPPAGGSARRTDADGEPPKGPDGVPLPARRLVALLRTGLEEGVPYGLQVTGVRNIAGLVLGGGESTVVWEPPPPDTAGADSVGAVPDTAAAPPDTSAARPDTSGAGEDAPRAPTGGRALLDRLRRPSA